MAYAFFDTFACPPLDLMARIKSETNLSACGFYLHAPSQPASSWRGKRAGLAAQGWGFAPVYVGQQVTGPGSHNITAHQGAADGADAARQMRAERFPPGSFVFLDLENGPPFVGAQQAYVGAWIDDVRENGYAAGVYCSFLFAHLVASLRPGVRIWTFHVDTTKVHPVPGRVFASPEPATSGFGGACMWQYTDTAKTSFNSLMVDFDSSIYADPSAADGRSPARPRPPEPVAPDPVGYPVGTIAWAQQALNTLGARPLLDVDGVAGAATRAAVARFQARARIYQDGRLGAQTFAALKAALAHRAA